MQYAFIMLRKVYIANVSIHQQMSIIIHDHYVTGSLHVTQCIYLFIDSMNPIVSFRYFFEVTASTGHYTSDEYKNERLPHTFICLL